MSTNPEHFEFGKNWEDFIEKNFSEARVELSKQHLLDFLQLETLKGNYFLDVGSGSGLSSLAAFRAGADRIVSFDVDPNSVKTTNKLLHYAQAADRWHVMEGSALDKAFLATLEPADILYSWGVLHHTGSMWAAIENMLPLTKVGGVFYIALYNTTLDTPFWTELKREYNRASELKKRLMEAWYIFRYEIVRPIRGRRNPFPYIFNYDQNRGMSFYTDVKDWLGGYPFETVTQPEVEKFFTDHGYQLVNNKYTTGRGISEFLFRRIT